MIVERVGATLAAFLLPLTKRHPLIFPPSCTFEKDHSRDWHTRGRSAVAAFMPILFLMCKMVNRLPEHHDNPVTQAHVPCQPFADLAVLVYQHYHIPFQNVTGLGGCGRDTDVRWWKYH